MKNIGDNHIAASMMLVRVEDLGIRRALLGPVLTETLEAETDYLQDRLWDVFWMFRLQAETSHAEHGDVDGFHYEANLTWGHSPQDGPGSQRSTKLMAAGILYDDKPTLYICLPPNCALLASMPTLSISRTIGLVVPRYREVIRSLSVRPSRAPTGVDPTFALSWRDDN